MKQFKTLPPELINKATLALLPYETWKEYRDQYELLVADAESTLKMIIEMLLKDHNVEIADNGLIPDVVREDEIFKQFKTHFNYCFELQRSFNGASPKKYQRQASKERRQERIRNKS